MHGAALIHPAIDIGRNGGEREEQQEKDEAHAAHCSYSASSIQAIWIASRIFSPQRLGSSSNPGSSCTHLNKSVNRTDLGSTSGWPSTSAMAMSCVSVHFTASCLRLRARS